MKLFYAIVIAILSLILGPTGCFNDEYGIEPTDYDDDPYVDENTVIDDDQTDDQTDSDNS